MNSGPERAESDDLRNGAAAERDLQRCEVCGAEKPAELVDHTTVETIAPLEADICESCQHVQNHSLPDGVCMKCGRDLEASFYMEVEFPLGPEDLPARLGGSLCGDCAGWVGTEVNYEAIDADEEAFQELIRLLDKHQEAQRADAPTSESDD